VYNILITGAGGQLGHALDLLLGSQHAFNPVALPHTGLDITDADSLRDCLDTHRIHLVVNTAAYTSVDLAESSPDRAWLVNAEGPRQIAIACRKKQIPLIHFSTDYVYHNALRRPLLETDPCNPGNVYGASKLAGEQKTLYHHPHTVVIRTSWLYGREGNNFVNTIKRLSSEKPVLEVVNDQIGAPTYVPDLAAATLTILSKVLPESGNPSWYGIFNFANEGEASWFDFASAIVSSSSTTCSVHPVATSVFPRPAARPSYSLFNLNKIKSTFHLSIRDWKTALMDCMGNS
jgi:dTDP-4-dehydrorhamnose reductase